MSWSTYFGDNESEKSNDDLGPYGRDPFLAETYGDIRSNPLSPLILSKKMSQAREDFERAKLIGIIQGNEYISKTSVEQKETSLTTFKWEDDSKKKVYFKDLEFNETFIIPGEPRVLYRKVHVIRPSIFGMLDEHTGNVLDSTEKAVQRVEVEVHIKF